MGFCNFKKYEVRWDLMPKLKIEDLSHIGVGIPMCEELNCKFQIDAKGSVLIKYKKTYMKPKDVQFLIMKRRYIKKGRMKPLKWVKLSNQLINRLKPFDILRVGDKFKLKCGDPVNDELMPVNIVESKTKTKIVWKEKGASWLSGDAVVAAEFNKETAWNGIIILNKRQ